MKAISPLIAAVIIVAVTIAIAIIVSGVITSVLESQTATATKTQKCPTTPINWVHYTCSNDIIKATITNPGSVELSNFTVFAVIEGTTYTNSSPVNGNSILKPGDVLTLEAAGASTGEISMLRVSTGGDCPGIFVEVTNDTIDIGTCS